MITPELRRVYASAPSEHRYLETLELAHPLFPSTFWLVNDDRAWRFALAAGGPLQPFQPVRFTAVPPTTDGKGQQDLTLVIDNVGREAVDAIEAAAADPTTNIAVTYRVYLDVEDSEPQNDPPLVLALQSIKITHEAIAGTATRADVLNRMWPSVLYDPRNFPGLNR
jgi:hypothetical protein